MTTGSQKQNIELKALCKALREKILRTSSEAKVPHLGSCLSSVEILVSLFWSEMRILLGSTDGDKFLLSKGHAAPALFQVLAMRGYYDESLLSSFGDDGSVFHEHPPAPKYLNGIEAATGSLGHGFSMGLGMAYGGKVRGLKNRTYILLGDGECNEGVIWEGAMFAVANSLNSVVAIVDYNGWQATARSDEVFGNTSLAGKWNAFGWFVSEVDGHDLRDLKDSFTQAKRAKRPSVLIAHTTKGKGVSFMEDDNNWHYRTPNQSELDAALRELRIIYEG